MWLKRITPLYIILLLNLISNDLSAQKIVPAGREHHFTNYSIAQGLFVPNVNSFYQDSKGNIWICGRNAVAKFDGIKFVHFTEKEGLPSGGAASVCEDKFGNIWFGTWYGLATLRNNKISLDTNGGMPKRLSWGLFVDADKTIWAANHEGVFHFDPSRSENKLIKKYTISANKEGNSFRKIFRNSKGDLIAGADVGCFVLKNDSLLRYNSHGIPTYAYIEFDDGREWFSGWDSPIYQYKNGKIDSVLNIGSMVLDMTKDQNGNVYLATWDKGLFKYNGMNFVNYTVKEGLPQNSFWSIFCDREENIWLGSWGSGISKYSSDLFTRFTEKSGLLNNVVNGIRKDSSGNYWFSAENGITKYASEQNISTQFEIVKNESALYSKITHMFVKSANEVWGLGYGVSGVVVKDGKISSVPEFCGFDAIVDKKKDIWLVTEGDLLKVNGDRKIIEKYRLENYEFSPKFSGLYEDLDGNKWITNSISGINFFDGKKIINLSKKNGFTNRAATAIVQYMPKRYLIAVNGKGIYNCYYDNYRFKIVDSITIGNGLLPGSITSLKVANENIFATSAHGLNIISLSAYKKGKVIVQTYSEDDGLLGKQCKIEFIDDDGSVWLSTDNGAFRFNPKAIRPALKEPIIHINSLKLFFEDTDWSVYSDTIIDNLPFALTLPYNRNHLTFGFTGVNHVSPSKVRYKYKMEGYDRSWTPAMNTNEATYSNISPGSYTFMVISCNKEGVWNKQPAVFAFTIRPPFWNTSWFYAICITTLFILIYAYTKYRERKLQSEKKVLEGKVNERTIQLKNAFSEIEQKNKEITDSINYSKRIQEAILPDENEIKSKLTDYFILYKPKDIVSGDFYYLEKTQNGCVVAVADCTGHGVPGAFMSLVGKENLDKAIELSSEPSVILSLLNKGIKKSLKQNKEDGTRDGMDIALCSIEGNKVKYAGANRPLVIVRHSTGLLEEIKAVKCAIGGLTDNAQEFVQHEFEMQKNDMLYLFSDGYADQFGGEKMKKITTKMQKQLFVQIAPLDAKSQKNYLNDYLNQWKGSNEQIDDVCVIGIKF